MLKRTSEWGRLELVLYDNTRELGAGVINILISAHWSVLHTAWRVETLGPHTGVDGVVQRPGLVPVTGHPPLVV